MERKVARIELLLWLNELLQLRYTKVEEAGSGAAYCQVFDSIYGDVPLHRVKFDATQEHEFIANYKILQQSFDKHRVHKEIPIQKLIKRRFTDNYDFMSWMKQFWEQHYGGGTYNALELRKAPPHVRCRLQSPRPPATAAPNLQLARAKQPPSHASSNGARRRIVSPANVSSFGTSPLLQRTHSNVTELMKRLARVQGERDYYYTKLREIETLCDEMLATHPSDQVVAVLEHLQAILFSEGTASERGAPSPALHDPASSPTCGTSETLPDRLAALSWESGTQPDNVEFDEAETF